jgi:hypothetical protein
MKKSLFCVMLVSFLLCACSRDDWDKALRNEKLESEEKEKELSEKLDNIIKSSLDKYYLKLPKEIDEKKKEASA